MKAGPDGARGESEGRGNLVVRQSRPRVQQQYVALTGGQLRERLRERGAERRRVDSLVAFDQLNGSVSWMAARA